MSRTSLNTQKRILFLWIAFLLALTPPLAFPSSSSDEVWRNLIRRGDMDGAIDGFKGIVKDNPQDVLAHAGLGMLYPSRVTEDDPLEPLLQAIEPAPDHPLATLILFQAHNKVSSREDAQRTLQTLNHLLEQEDLPDHVRSRAQFIRADLFKRLGKWQEAEQAYQSLNFITSFWYCGPFDNNEKRGHNQVYGVEQNLNLNATYEGRHRTVFWRPVSIDPYDGYIDLHTLTAPSRESSTYLVTAFHSEEDQNCTFTFGHAGALKAWHNGQLISDMVRYHSPTPDQVNVNVRLSKGLNTLLLKLSSGEKGKYGAYVRAIPDDPEQVEWIDSKGPQEPDLTSHTPAPDQEKPVDFNQEPIALQQLKVLSESETDNPQYLVFYVLLLEAFDVADETDQISSTIISQLNSLFQGNPFLLRLLGDVEQQDNRRRLAYQKALDMDPEDLASYLSLLSYYRASSYATKGLELIKKYERYLGVPPQALMEKAGLLYRNDLREAAIDILESLIDEGKGGLKAKRLLLEHGSYRLTDQQLHEVAQEILEEDQTNNKALSTLRNYALRKGREEAFQQLMDHEQKLDPFSLAGLIDQVQYEQSRGNYQKALELLNQGLILSPDNFQLHKLAAIAYHNMGNDLEALRSLQEALNSKPSDPWCLEYQDYLQPEVDDYATPYLKPWQSIEIPESLDLSEANYVTLQHQEIIKVHSNGNASETVRDVVKVLTDSGVKMHQARGIYYQGDREKVRITRARVWKPDGTFVDAPAPERRSTASEADAARRLYGDYNVAILRFPSLEKGCTIEVEYEKKKTRENIYADYFGHIFYVGDTQMEPLVQTEFVLLTPDSRDFYWKYIPPNYPESLNQSPEDFNSEPEITENDDQRIYHWTFHEIPNLPEEPLMPFASEIIPYIKVSTFQTWDEMTDWYWNLVKDQFVSGPVVKQKTQQVLEEYKAENGYDIEDELSDWDKVKAINAWVNTKVRYLGLEFGIYGYKPHKVDQVCNAQYGDCKDKALLAMAMLKEAGIEAYFVIIRTTHLGEFDYELPMLGMFNHAIYYLPDVDGKERWIDGTATFYGADELPAADAGANTLIVKPGGDSFFKRIPHSTPEENGGTYTTVLKLDPEGNAEGSRSAEFNGLFNPVVRNTYENQAKAKERIDQVLSNQFPGSESSNIQISDLDHYDTPENLYYEMTLPQFATKRDKTLSVPSTLFEESFSQRYAQLSEREYDLVLNYPSTRTNINRITLPPDFADVDLPPDQTLETEFGSYTRTSQLEDDTVSIEETIIFKPVRVAKEDYPDFREFCRLVDLHQDEKMTVEMK